MHRCLIYEPMGSHKRRHISEQRRYPKAIVKQILKHAQMGLVTLHSRGIVHGDLQPGNMLFTTRGLEYVDEARLMHYLDCQTQALYRVDARRDKWAPRYRALPQPLYEYVDFDNPVEIKLSDLGAGRSSDHIPAITSLT